MATSRDPNQLNLIRPDLDEVVESLPPMSERGATGLKHQAGYIDDEWLPQLRGTKAIKVYREMADNSAVVGSAFRGMKAFILATPWEITPRIDGNPEAERQAIFVEQCFGDMSHTVPEFLSDVLSLLPFGHSYHSMVMKLRLGESGGGAFNSQYDDGYYGFRKLPIRSQDSLEQWDIDDDGSVDGVWQMAAPKYLRTYLPLRESLLFRTESNKSNPEGRSLLRNAYRSWFFLKRIQEFEAIGVERNMAGLVVFRLPPSYFKAGATADQKKTLAAYKLMSAKMRQGEHAGLAFPASTDSGGETGFAVDTLQGAGKTIMDTNPIITRLESRIALSLLAEVSLLGLQGNVGSWALADVKERMGMLALRSVTTAIEDVINRFAIPRLIGWNGWERRLSPLWKFGDIDATSIATMIPALSSAISVGAMTPDQEMEKFLRTRLGIPHGDDMSLGQLQDAVGRASEQDPVEAASEVAGAAMDSVPIEEEKAESMSADEAAALVGVNRGTIMRAIRGGRLPGAKLGNQYRIIRSDLLEFMRNQRDAK